MAYMINVTNWVPPNRDREDWQVDVRDDVAPLAKELVDAGYIFEFEVLRNVNTGSATLGDPKLEIDHIIVLQSPQESFEYMTANGFDNPVEAIFNKVIVDGHAKWVSCGRPVAGVEWVQENVNAE
jgi:hypothetical protein